MVLPFNSLKDIFKTDYSLGSINGSANLDNFLLAPKGSIYKMLADEIILKDPTNMPTTFEEALLKTKHEKYAFVYNTDAMLEMNKNKCDFIEIPDDISTSSIGFGWNKNLPHRHIFDFFLKNMIERGQVDRILRKWKPKQTPRHNCGTNEDFVSMGMENMVSAFAMIGAATAVAACILMLEIVVNFIRVKLGYRNAKVQ